MTTHRTVLFPGSLAAKLNAEAIAAQKKAVKNASEWLDKRWKSLIRMMTERASWGETAMEIDEGLLLRWPEDSADIPTFWAEALMEKLKKEGFRVKRTPAGVWVSWS